MARQSCYLQKQITQNGMREKKKREKYYWNIIDGIKFLQICVISFM